MRKAVFFILLILLLNPRPFKASAREQYPGGAVSPRNDGAVSPRNDGAVSPRNDGAVSPRTDGAAAPAPAAVPQKVASYADGEDDIFSNTYERELLSRRFFQKTLPPLKPREKIVWSFKTARANLLL
jgi:hypothetical protein